VCSCDRGVAYCVETVGVFKKNLQVVTAGVFKRTWEKWYFARTTMYVFSKEDSLKIVDALRILSAKHIQNSGGSYE